MNSYNFTNLSILQALRELCNNLYLNGESQQLERILASFSDKWFASNPSNGFKCVDVVNLICYSLVILNGDLHKPEVESKMTRAQFIRNTMPPLGDVAIDRVPDAFIDPDSTDEHSPTRQLFRRRSQSPQKAPNNNSEYSVNTKRSFDCARPSQRLAQRPSEPIITTLQRLEQNSTVAGDCGPLVNAPFVGKRIAWEKQIESMLRKFYTSIREQPLPTLPPDEQSQQLSKQRSTNTLPMPYIKRSPSMISKAVSENQVLPRGRGSEARLSTHRWQSARPRPPPINTRATSTRSSFDAQSSPPSPSSIWSKVSNVGKTQTTMSIYSLASSAPRAEYQQAIGFANALSHAIIKEEGIDPAIAANEEDGPTTLRRSQCLEDESLELEGAPWAKEGLIKHKHVLESHGTRARSRQWSSDNFAVIERGYLRLFSFTKNSTIRWKRRSWESHHGQNKVAPGAVVGGGNWMDNAELLHTFELRHTIATALGTNSYSRSRPHVWALNLPDGALHLFSAGTPEIAREFTDTANYWAARTSKKPFAAGYTNANYGFENHNNINNNNNANTTSRNGNGNGNGNGGSTSGLSTNQQQQPPLTLWHPPMPSMASSQLLEVDQLHTLRSYLTDLGSEMSHHAALRAQVGSAYRDGDARAVQALGNWDAKARYLSAEKGKVETFVAALVRAGERKEGVYRDREDYRNGVRGREVEG